MTHSKPADECLGRSIVINGRLQPVEKFKDRVLFTGTSIYEVIRIQNRTPLFLEDHIERLYRSGIETGAKNLPSPEEIGSGIYLLLNGNADIENGNIRLLIHFPVNLQQNPDSLFYYIPHFYPTPQEYENGVALITLKSERSNVHSKVIDLQFRSNIRKRVTEAGAYEALLVNKHGFITEGSKSNIFMIGRNRIVTPPGEDVLQGITRKNILKICYEKGIEATEERINFASLVDYESCFISGTSPGVLAVRNIDEYSFNSSHILLRRLSREYNIMVNGYINKNKLNLSNI